MNIKILAVGKLKEKYWQAALSEYSKRLGAYVKLQVIEVKADSEEDIEVEGERLLTKIDKKDYVISLEIKGETVSSEAFATKMEGLMQTGRGDVCFVIGGSQGLSDEVTKRSDLSLALSEMTFPHQMIRVFLIEQIYRAFNLISGGKYHK